MRLKCLVCLWVSLVCCSCQTHWNTFTIPYSQKQIKQACQDVILAQGYKVDPSQKNLHSEWQYNLSPYPRQGYRTRIEIQIKPNASQCLVKLRIFKEINYARYDPLNIDYALWTPQGFYQAREKFIASLIQTKLYLLEKKKQIVS